MSFSLADLKNPAALERVQELFGRARFLEHVGIRLQGAGPGWAECALEVSPLHGQAEGFVHAGVQATLADHTSGAACGTLIAADQTVLAVEFKVSLLRPAQGERLSCRAEVIRAGRRLMFTEAKVMAHVGEQSKVVATFTSTVAVVSLEERGR